MNLHTGFVAVLQADGPVEHQVAGGAVLAVRAEVAQAHELIGCGGLGVFQAGFHLAAGEYFQRIRVQAGQEILAGGVGVRVVEQVGILTDLRIGAVVGIYPMDGGTLDLSAVSGVAALAARVVGCLLYTSDAADE